MPSEVYVSVQASGAQAGAQSTGSFPASLAWAASRRESLDRKFAGSSLLRAETGATGCVDVTVDKEGYDHNKVEGIPSSQSLYNQVQLSENQ